ncbi:phosphoenolpyruvate synthase [Desulfocucumis palustris]|uniref:Phosphoenolpyruvate synthase n=1 Tax=Desulfocucumis palustris TaxID=1898651 RepID=A0A2L2X9D2_9FIRM|nr:phosphoenolpyruvate synthase [Desulfocucumis palustris]GBF32805.1 phosphoenolpyruvate synthase [Desulfocucumis palustris]
MGSFVVSFNEINKTSLPDVGGKGANLGEMSRAGLPVPPGFCVTTSAYRRFIAASDEMDRLLDSLGRLQPEQQEKIRELARQIRDHLQSAAMPGKIKSEIIDIWKNSGEEQSYAVRSSATAEDLPSASFAGQQETYLNVQGAEQLLQAVQKCWASLFTDRAIVYRAKNGFDHRAVYLSVVVQQMVFPEVSGIMFTADPVTGHRHTVSIDAGFGLGEALVSGIVTADLYQVRKGQLYKKQIAEKKKAVYPLSGGGTVVKDLSPALQSQQALPDEKIMELAELGQRIEKHFGSEQDIEWCLAGDKFYILQSRPITSLYPVPQVADHKLHVFFSLAHQQMMMDAMKPLAISIFRRIFPFGKDSVASPSPVILEAGGRLFFDSTVPLYSKLIRRFFIRNISVADDLMGDALSKFVAGEDFQREAGENRGTMRQLFKMFKPVLPFYFKGIPGILNNLFFRDPPGIIERAMAPLEQVINSYERSIMQASGAERIKRVRESVGGLLEALSDSMVHVPLGFFVLPVAGRLAKRWLDDELDVSSISKSLPGNVTSEMGLMIGDLADVARKYPEVADYLEKTEGGTFYQGLNKIKGGEIFKAELDKFMEHYGIRCPGEIDISNIRWREAPAMLIPSILNHMKSNGPGEHRERFKQGEKEAGKAIQNLLARVGKTPGGRFKVKLMSRLLAIYRNSMGLREFPKYALVRTFDIYRRAVLKEAGSLREKGILRQEDDVFYLYIEELEALLEHRLAEDAEALIDIRKKNHEHHQKLAPPRVMTSDGEAITGIRSGVEVPEGALAGTPVSSGVAEGYVKVVLRPEEAKLNKGDILVAPFTDPGWTPLFHSAKALVVEIGGMMTHGSVIAREYGIPAVVGVDNATKLLNDGQYVRVDGTKGFVEILAEKGKQS